VDLTAMPAELRDLEAARLAFAESHRRFDLERGPMLRATLLRLSTDEHMLLLTCHHIVADGWSIGILFCELVALYGAYCEGEFQPLPELPIQYGDYAAWQQKWLESSSYREQLAYWKKQLVDLPPHLCLPTDRPRNSLKTTRGARHFLSMDRSLFAGLVALARQMTATPFMGLLAAFAALLYRYSGRSDIALGSPVAGRSQPETQGLIGCFSNTLVLRSRSPEDATFRQLLLHVREITLGALDHSDVPFERLVQELRQKRDPLRMSFFQVNLRLLTTQPPPSRLGPVVLEFLRVDNRRVKFDLSVEFWEESEALAGYFEYSTDLFDPCTIGAMIDDFSAMVRAVTAHADVPLRMLDVSIRLRTESSGASLSTNRSEDSMTPLPRASQRKPVPLAPGGDAMETSLPARPEPPRARYQLRQAMLRDSDFLYRLRKRTMAQFVEQYPDWTEAHQEAFYMDFEPATHSIIIVDGQEAGAIGVRRSDAEFYFANLHLLPEFQGRWLGTWIFRDLMAEAAARGVPIRFHVMKNNPARRLYERLGFSITAETDIRYEMMWPRAAAEARASQIGATPPLSTERKESCGATASSPVDLRRARRQAVETRADREPQAAHLGPDHLQTVCNVPPPTYLCNGSAGKVDPLERESLAVGDKPKLTQRPRRSVGISIDAARHVATDSIPSDSSRGQASTCKPSLAGFANRGVEILFNKDPELCGLLDAEYQRQTKTLVMVAASSVAEPSVRACEAAVATNVTTEGYAGVRSHGGCEVVDQIERLAIERARAAFGARFANVQPRCGSSANEIVMLALLKPGDKILGMDLNCGGLRTRGSRASISGRVFDAIAHGVDPSGFIDYDHVSRLAEECQPKLIIAGASEYSRSIDFERYRTIADRVGAYLLADISHIAGLVVAGIHPNPIDHAHFTTTSTCKQLYGPRGGLILMGKDHDRLTGDGQRTLSEMIQKTSIPFFQRTPDLSGIAAKARALALVATVEFRQLAVQMVSGAAALAGYLSDLGYRVLTGGTDNHLILIDIADNGVTGIIAERALEECGVIVNKSKIPGDQKSPSITSGLRLGTNTLALRGMGADQMPRCAALIDRVLKGLEVRGDTEYVLDEAARRWASQEVQDLCREYPLREYPITGVADRPVPSSGLLTAMA
jgi:glycine hydroxymethyltransferase